MQMILDLNGYLDIKRSSEFIHSNIKNKSKPNVILKFILFLEKCITVVPIY